MPPTGTRGGSAPRTHSRRRCSRCSRFVERREENVEERVSAASRCARIIMLEYIFHLRNKNHENACRKNFSFPKSARRRIRCGRTTRRHTWSARARASRASASICGTTRHAGDAWWRRRTSSVATWCWPAPRSASRFPLCRGAVPGGARDAFGTRRTRLGRMEARARRRRARGAAARGSAPSGARRARLPADTPRSARLCARSRKSTPARTPEASPPSSALCRRCTASAPRPTPRLLSRRTRRYRIWSPLWATRLTTGRDETKAKPKSVTSPEKTTWSGRGRKSRRRAPSGSYPSL